MDDVIFYLQKPHGGDMIRILRNLTNHPITASAVCLFIIITTAFSASKGFYLGHKLMGLFFLAFSMAFSALFLWILWNEFRARAERFLWRKRARNAMIHYSRLGDEGT